VLHLPVARLTHWPRALISMRERLQLVGGQFFIESKPGWGTTIRARVPLMAQKLRASAGG